MILTVTTLTGQMFPMDVAEDLELENFKAICEAESGFPAEDIILLVNNDLLETLLNHLKS